MDQSVAIILISSTICTLIYLLLGHIFSQKPSEWHCRVVTIMHALCVVTASGWCAFVEGPWPFTDAGGPNTHLQIVIVSVSLGYFLFDFTWCMWFQTEGPTMLIHHIFSILGMSVTLATGQYGTEIVATIFGSEFSNPILQTRWFLKYSGKYDTIYGDIIDVLFVVSFGVMRFGIGTYLLYTYFQNPRTNFLGRLAAVCFYLVSWMFWVGIMQFAFYKFKKKFVSCCNRNDNGDSNADSLQNQEFHKCDTNVKNCDTYGKDINQGNDYENTHENYEKCKNNCEHNLGKNCENFEQKCENFEQNCGDFEQNCDFEAHCGDFEQNCGDFEQNCGDFEQAKVPLLNQGDVLN